jgi:putative drug exporter of the RND superfamily
VHQLKDGHVSHERARLSQITTVGIRHPRAVLATWLILVAALAVAGARVSEQLHRTNPVVTGSSSGRETTRSSALFGASNGTLIALLEGSRSALDAGGPRVVSALERIPHVRAVSPWTPGSAPALRPRPGKAIVLLSVTGGLDQASKQTVPSVRAALEKSAPRSIAHHLTGYADVTSGIARDSLQALQRAEFLAAPALLVILLLVFGSPVAAGVPLFLGLSSILAGRGVLAGVNASVMPLDSVALELASMFGLALGVDYSLLLVSRFREELDRGLDTREAAIAAVGTAGRTVIVAGGALALAMVVGYLVAPAQVLASGSAGGLVGVLLSMLGALTVLPALLVLLGPRMNRWRFARRDFAGSWGTLAWRAIRRPGVVTIIVLVPLVALATQAGAVTLRPPGTESLTPHSAERVDEEAISRSIGPGWGAPYDILVSSQGRRPVTDPHLLAAMVRWQQQLERDPAVAAVFGPASLLDALNLPPHGDHPQPSAARVLASLRSLPAAQRSAIGLVLNLTRGGTGMLTAVIGRDAPDSGRSADRLREQIERGAAGFPRLAGVEVSVGGPGATLQDFTTTSEQRLPLLILVLAIVTFVILVVLLRSIPIAAITVLLNVLTVCVALGVLELLFQRSHVLGSTGPLDAIITPAMIAVSFGLAIDYEVFLLGRLREVYLATGDTDAAIRAGLSRTAGLITGAALVMSAVFLAFASADIANLREFGVGLTIAVLLDATVVRLILLPAMIRLLGRHAWWMPAWLKRPPARRSGPTGTGRPLRTLAGELDGPVVALKPGDVA